MLVDIGWVEFVVAVCVTDVVAGLMVGAVWLSVFAVVSGTVDVTSVENTSAWIFTLMMSINIARVSICMFVPGLTFSAENKATHRRYPVLQH